MPTIRYIVVRDWQHRSSGVFTFVCLVFPYWQEMYSLRFVYYNSNEKKGGRSYSPPKVRTDLLKPSGRPWLFGLRLIAGYVQMLCKGMKELHPRRAELMGGIILLNDFGAEVRPIACRFLLPFAKIVAIAHTHPNLSDRDYLGRRLVERICYWSCSKVVFNSYALKQMWEQKLGRRIGKGIVVHHGIDLPDSMTVPSAYPERGPSTIDVVCIGLFYRWKGQLALINAWPEVMSTCREPVRLVLVGDGTCLGQARTRVSELGIEKHVAFCGYQQNGADFFNGGDIAIHYPVEPEAFGLVLLEAMGRGKPVIAPAHGGATEIVLDGETGLLVEPGKRDSLVEAVCQLAEDAGLRKSMGDAGRKRVQTAFSVEKMLAGYDRVFQQVSGSE
jgi:glycosyltransferase involved in cell wall biosynthesis